MKVNKNSWHYKLNNDIFNFIKVRYVWNLTLCKYFWITVFNFIFGTTLFSLLSLSIGLMIYGVCDFVDFLITGEKITPPALLGLSFVVSIVIFCLLFLFCKLYDMYREKDI